MKLTIFTPTYNRGYIIENLYRSLQRQTVMDFEWLVVDDGSTDGTAKLFEQWQREGNPFPIRYYYKENGGKCRAINYGVPLADGECFYIVDSDDYISDNAIERIIYWMKSITGQNRRFAGVCGCKAYTNNGIIGRTFNGDYLDCTSLERGQHGIEGDKAEVFYTDILRLYPFPEFENETFLTECVVWDKIAEDGYILRFFNETICLCEYREDGLSQQGLDIYYKNPQGYGHYLRMCRKNQKFSKLVSDYFDVECYKHWRSAMSLEQIASLIGTEKMLLFRKYLFYSIKEKGSKIKHKILGK